MGKPSRAINGNGMAWLVQRYRTIRQQYTQKHKQYSR